MKLALKAVVLALAVIVAYPAWIGFQVWQQSRHDEVHSADAIVVLGAAQYNGRPSEVFKARLDHAAYLYGEGLSDTVVVTGGKQPGDNYTEAEAGERYLTGEKGLPPERILEETAGRTTWESLQAVRDLARDNDIRSLLLVSDPMHSERLKRMADDLGFEETYVSWAGYQQLHRSRLTKAKELVREVASIMAYELLDR